MRTSHLSKHFAVGSALALAAALTLFVGTARAIDSSSIEESPKQRPRPNPIDWPSYGRDEGGSRYSELGDITPENVRRLTPAWTYHTGDLPKPNLPSKLASEVTPVVSDGSLYLCTPYNRVISLDAETGAENWIYDPQIDLEGDYANQLVCRGVAFWRDPAEPEVVATCRKRVFTATNDARLIALDAETGSPCGGFGESGVVDLNPGVGNQEWRGEYQVTSPPALAGDLVIVGSAVSDNQRVDAPSGVVRAYDARSGALRWAWDLRPPGFVATPENTSDAGYALATPNVWAPMAVDSDRDLLFVPTGNPAPDFFREKGRELDHYGSSIVALRASTGAVVWRFQTVHRDLWDYDVASQPTLFTLRRPDGDIPALVQGTKMGFLFVLHRETGEPLFPVEERSVPQSAVPGQSLSPTQPFPVKPPPLATLSLDPADAFGITPWDRGRCRRQLESLRFEGIYTPPSLEGTLVFPGNAGGVNWGGLAVDESRQWLVVNTQNLPFRVTLVEREQAAGRTDVAPMRGTPYVLDRQLLLSPLGLPCNPPPWGHLTAVDLSTGDIAWRRSFGTTRDLLPVPIEIEIGTPGLGGPLLTGGGLVFIGAAFDHYLRAFDAKTGAELWKGRIPAGGQATPMTFRSRPGGRQLVVIAATGYGQGGLKVSDAIVAFALAPDSQ